MLCRALFALLVASLPASALAEDIGWSGEIEFNGSSTTGNNETLNAGTKVRFKNRGYDWRHDFAGSADYGEAEGDTNKQRFRISYKVGRDLSEKSYLYLNADYYSDDFGAYKNGYFAGGGYGYTLVSEGPTHWKVEAGAGYRSQKARFTENTLADPNTQKENFASARLFSEIEHELNDNVSISNDTELFYSDIDTYIISDSAVTSDMFGLLALRASFRIESHSDVPAGREKTDTITRLGVVFSLD